MRRNLVAPLACLLLPFTGGALAWADEAQPFRAQDSGVRGGTIVGYSAYNGDEYLTLGLTTAVGHRFGRFTLEAEYDYLSLQSGGDQSVELGVAQRLGINGRVDVLRAGQRWVGKNSRVVLWTELGLGRQHTTWTPDAAAPTMDPDERAALRRRLDAMTDAPPRPDVAIGFGWLFEHMVEQPRGFPIRIGWQFGWRITGAEQASSLTPLLACRSSACAPTPTRNDEHDVTLLVASSFLFSW